MKVKLPVIITNHPRLTTWAILAVGMVALLLWESRNVGLQGSQLAFLVLMTILLAGACAWMIGWGDDEADDDGFDPAQAETQTDETVVSVVAVPATAGTSSKSEALGTTAAPTLPNSSTLPAAESTSKPQAKTPRKDKKKR